MSSIIIMNKFMNLINDKKPYKLFSLFSVSVIPSRRMSTDLPSLRATVPPPEAVGKRVKSEPKAPWEYKREEDLEESDFSIYDDDSEKAMIEFEKAIAEYQERSRNLSPYDAIAPPPLLCGGIVPMRITDDLRPRLTKLCNLALEKYNADNQGANFEFHDLVKSTTQLVSGRIYYITFEAKDATHPSNDAARTFQAKVWVKFHPRDAEPEVMSCSMKPT